MNLEFIFGRYSTTKDSRIQANEVTDHIPSGSDRDEMRFDRRMYPDFIDADSLQYCRINHCNFIA